MSPIGGRPSDQWYGSTGSAPNMVSISADPRRQPGTWFWGSNGPITEPTCWASAFGVTDAKSSPCLDDDRKIALLALHIRRRCGSGTRHWFGQGGGG